MSKELIARNQAAAEYSNYCEICRFWSRVTKIALLFGMCAFLSAISIAAVLSI